MNLEISLSDKNDEIRTFEVEKEKIYEQEKIIRQINNDLELINKNSIVEIEQLKVDILSLETLMSNLKDEKHESDNALQEDITQLKDEVSMLKACRDELKQGILASEGKLSASLVCHENFVKKSVESKKIHESEQLQLKRQIC